jgi:hypothetical protein
LFHVNDFEFSEPQNPIHYSLAGNSDVLDIVVHQNIRLSHVIVSDILDSDYLRIVFQILEHVDTKKLSKPFEKFTDSERFQNLACKLISRRIEINSGVEADIAALVLRPPLLRRTDCRPVRLKFQNLTVIFLV